MLETVQRLEEKLARIEAILLVFFVLLMLGLATYNVFYRNVLVPIQVSVLTEDEPALSDAPSEPPPSQPATADEKQAAEAEGAAGFGGGFGDEGAGGFGGGFGEPATDDGADEPEAPSAEEPSAAADPTAGFGGGFGGDFGDAPAADAEAEADDEPEDSAGGFGGGFGGGFDAPEPEKGEGAAVAEPAPAPTPAGPPKEAPFIAELVDALKIEWIDVLLRQLVLVVGFLGAMLATRRRKHITIDALSKLLSDKALHWSHVVTNLVALIVCLFLVKAGTDLVEIGVEFPKELMNWADEWHFQLIFPFGFALLSLHFAIRIFESLMWATGKAEPAEDVRGGLL